MWCAKKKRKKISTRDPIGQQISFFTRITQNERDNKQQTKAYIGSVDLPVCRSITLLQEMRAFFVQLWASLLLSHDQKGFTITAPGQPHAVMGLGFFPYILFLQRFFSLSHPLFIGVTNRAMKHAKTCKNKLKQAKTKRGRKEQEKTLQCDVDQLSI